MPGYTEKQKYCYVQMERFKHIFTGLWLATFLLVACFVEGRVRMLTGIALGLLGVYAFRPGHNIFGDLGAKVALAISRRKYGEMTDVDLDALYRQHVESGGLRSGKYEEIMSNDAAKAEPANRAE